MEALFQKNIVIYGKHSQYLKALVAKPDTELKSGLFERAVDVLVAASVIGKIYNRKGEADSTKNVNGEEIKTTMFVEQITTVLPDLLLNYRMIMLLEDKEILPVEERVNRAFRYDRDKEKRPKCEKIYMSYVLGGIEVLYEKLIEPSKTVDDYVMNMYRFVDDFKRRYYKDEVNEEIYNLCKLAAN